MTDPNQGVSTGPAGGTTRRVALELDLEAETVLGVLRASTGRATSAEVLRDALGVYHALSELLAEGGGDTKLALYDPTEHEVSALELPTLAGRVSAMADPYWPLSHREAREGVLLSIAVDVHRAQQLLEGCRPTDDELERAMSKCAAAHHNVEQLLGREIDYQGDSPVPRRPLRADPGALEIHQGHRTALASAASSLDAARQALDHGSTARARERIRLAQRQVESVLFDPRGEAPATGDDLALLRSVAHTLGVELQHDEPAPAELEEVPPLDSKTPYGPAHICPRCQERTPHLFSVAGNIMCEPCADRMIECPHSDVRDGTCSYCGADMVLYRIWHAQEAQRERACDVPPAGWWCSRTKGHKGPCAAHKVST